MTTTANILALVSGLICRVWKYADAAWSVGLSEEIWPVLFGIQCIWATSIRIILRSQLVAFKMHRATLYSEVHLPHLEIQAASGQTDSMIL